MFRLNQLKSKKNIENKCRPEGTTTNTRYRHIGACWDLLECCYQLFSTSQNSISNLFEKKIKFLGFHAVVLMKTFPFMYQLN